MNKWKWEPIKMTIWNDIINKASMFDAEKVESTVNKVMVAIDRNHGGGWSTRWTICPMDYEVNILFKALLSGGSSEMSDVLINKIYELCCSKGVVSIKDGKRIDLDDIRELDIKLEYVNDGDEFQIGNFWISDGCGGVWEDHIWEKIDIFDKFGARSEGSMFMTMDEEYGLITVESRPVKRYKAIKEK